MIKYCIQEDGKIYTVVEFNGNIGVSALINANTQLVNAISFSELKEQYEIGTSFPEYKGKPYEKSNKDVIFDFKSYKSVDVVIEVLNQLRESLFQQEVENNKTIILKHNLYSPILYKGKEIIPILELAKISFPDEEWEVNIAPACVSNTASGFTFDEDGLFFRYESNDSYMDVIEYVEKQEELIELIKGYYNE